MATFPKNGILMHFKDRGLVGDPPALVKIIGITLLMMALPQTLAQAQAPIYQATAGYLAVEAEAHPSPLPNRWSTENLFTGASGGGYLRTTQNSFGTPGLGILNYDFEVDMGGSFQFAMRSQVGEGTSGTDSNDTWVRLVDSAGNPIAPRANSNDIRAGQWLKAYQNSVGRWNYQASNVDRVGRSISWQLTDDTRYALQVSARSRGFLLDRLFLWDQDVYNFANEERGFTTGASQTSFDALSNSAPVSAVPEPSSLVLLVAGIAGVCLRRRR